jgi:phage FluMu protein Com
MDQPLDPTLQCFECKKVAAAASNLQRCSRCKNISYCVRQNDHSD